MIYKLSKTVSADEFAGEITKSILDKLEKLEEMIPDDLDAIESPISEISEYLENVQDQIAIANKENEIERELQRQHEKGLLDRRV